MSATPQVVTVVVESSNSGNETRYISTQGYVSDRTDTPYLKFFCLGSRILLNTVSKLVASYGAIADRKYRSE